MMDAGRGFNDGIVRPKSPGIEERQTILASCNVGGERSVRTQPGLDSRVQPQEAARGILHEHETTASSNQQPGPEKSEYVRAVKQKTQFPPVDVWGVSRSANRPGAARSETRSGESRAGRRSIGSTRVAAEAACCKEAVGAHGSTGMAEAGPITVTGCKTGGAAGTDAMWVAGQSARARRRARSNVGVRPGRTEEGEVAWLIRETGTEY